MEDAETEARVKNGKLILSGPDGKVRYTLSRASGTRNCAAGPYKVRVEGADGLTLDTPEFTLKKGGQVTVRVTAVPKAVVKATDPDRKAAEYVLSLGGAVRVNGKDRDIKVGRRPAAGAFRLTRIELPANERVDDAGLANCKGCKHLRCPQPCTGDGCGDCGPGRLRGIART